MEHGVLYVSHRFKVAIHLCACGCCEEVVTPFNIEAWPDKDWSYTEDGTLHPSIGNQNYTCRSHYFVTEKRIVWLAPFPPK
jgi:hypothetical protein